MEKFRFKDNIHGSFNIKTSSNFPIKSGLASSSSCYAGLALCLRDIFNLSEIETGEIARIGSGSACRSLYSGLVHWKVPNNMS